MKINGVTMVDTGRKFNKEEMPSVTKSSENRIDYPSFWLTMPGDEKFPAVKQGKTVVLVAVAEIKSRTDSDRNGKKTTELSMDVKKVGFTAYSPKRPRDMSDRELNDAIRNGTSYEE